MKFSKNFNSKQFFRFTGPPENWLTAIKYMTWGLEQKFYDRWQDIQTGDVFFIHSTGGKTSFFNNAESGIIGIGVVGPNFTIKNNPLWLREVEKEENLWPLLVPFSEIYLFNEIPNPKSWETPSLSNLDQTKGLVSRLVQNRIPISTIEGFPQMGSFSSVSDSVAKQILLDEKPIYVYSREKTENIGAFKTTKLLEVNSASETLRYAESLQIFDEIKRRTIKNKGASYVKNNELLARAEDTHSSIIESLIKIFRSKGYSTLSNRFVDLFVHNGNTAFLFEVKSTENKNFRSQARKGIVQLFEYDYFEIKKFESENQINFDSKAKILVPSQRPEDNSYVEFINKLGIGMANVKDESLVTIGQDYGLNHL